MIEVEKKFFIKPEDLATFLADAKFITTQTYTDAYLDTPDNFLTTKDKWLRLRNDKFQLELPSTSGQYYELVSDDQIQKAVGIISNDHLFTALKKHGFRIFCQMTTTRKIYKKDGFIINIDEVDFGYNLGEIELMLDDETKISETLDSIRKFAIQYHLTLLPVRAKIFEFIKRHDQLHYQQLVIAGIVQNS